MTFGEGKFKFWSEHAANANSICHDFGNQLYGMHILWGADGYSICNDFAINWKWCIYHQAEKVGLNT